MRQRIYDGARLLKAERLAKLLDFFFNSLSNGKSAKIFECNNGLTLTLGR